MNIHLLTALKSKSNKQLLELGIELNVFYNSLENSICQEGVMNEKGLRLAIITLPSNLIARLGTMRTSQLAITREFMWIVHPVYFWSYSWGVISRLSTQVALILKIYSPDLCQKFRTITWLLLLWYLVECSYYW